MSFQENQNPENQSQKLRKSEQVKIEVNIINGFCCKQFGNVWIVKEDSVEKVQLFLIRL